MSTTMATPAEQELAELTAKAVRIEQAFATGSYDGVEELTGDAEHKKQQAVRLLEDINDKIAAVKNGEREQALKDNDERYRRAMETRKALLMDRSADMPRNTMALDSMEGLTEITSRGYSEVMFGEGDRGFADDSIYAKMRRRENFKEDGINAFEMLGLRRYGERRLAVTDDWLRQFAETSLDDAPLPAVLIDQMVTREPEQPPTLLEAMDIVPVTREKVTHLAHDSATANAAAFRAEGAAAVESTLRYRNIDTLIRSMATSLPVTNETLDDIGYARTAIPEDLRTFVLAKASAALIGGTGVAPQYTGFANVAGKVTDVAHGTDVNSAVTIGKALGAVAAANFRNANRIIMNDADWWEARVDITNGIWALGAPTLELAPRLFGVPIILDTSTPAGTAVICTFGLAASFFAMRADALLESQQLPFTEFTTTYRTQLRGSPVHRQAKAIVEATGI